MKKTQNQKPETSKLSKALFIFLVAISLSTSFVLHETKTAQAAFGDCLDSNHEPIDCNHSDATTQDDMQKAADKAADGDSWATMAVKGVLRFILKVTGWFLNLALVVFQKMAAAETIDGIISSKNSAIYETWGLVRDLCNMGFILVLIFSAFSTVFQYSSYNYKNRLLWLVIMALLINFSYPIARVVIDMSNVFMYTVFKYLAPDEVRLVDVLFLQSPAFTALANIMTAKGADVPQLIISIIFVFVLALTILAISLILLIRIVALSIIIILSPFGFFGTVIGKDGGWWKNLFKYSMAGPLIAICLLLSIKLMDALGKATDEMGGVAVNGVQAPNDVVVGMVKFIPPIVILWIGMGMAVSGIEGAGKILGKAQGYAKGTATGLWKATGIPGGIKKGWEKARKSGKLFGAEIPLLKNNQEEREAKMGGFFSGGTEGYTKAANEARTTKNKKDIEDDSKDIIDKGADVSSLTPKMNEAFGMNPAPTDRKTKIEHAAHAQAYLKQENDDRKGFILSQLRSGTAGVTATGDLSGTELDNILNSEYIEDPRLDAAANASKKAQYDANKTKALDAATTIIGRHGTAGYNPETDLRTVHTFINQQMKRKIALGANA